MSMTLTLILLAVSAVLAVGAFYMDSREPHPLKPRMVPWMIVGLAIVGLCIMLLVNVVNLMGIETGQGR